MIQVRAVLSHLLLERKTTFKQVSHFLLCMRELCQSVSCFVLVITRKKLFNVLFRRQLADEI